MDRRAILVLLLPVAGCQDVLGLRPLPGRSADAAMDGAPFACAALPPAELCADFDEATPLAYENGVPTMLPTPQSGAGFSLCSPGVSPPSALCIDSQTSSYDFGHTGVGSAISHLHATFELNILRAPPYAVEVVGIGISGTHTGDCIANLQVYAPDASVRIMTECAGSRETAIALPGVPVGWVHCELDYDIPRATATLAIGGGAPALVDLSSYQPVTGPPRVSAGVLYAQAPVGAAIQLDDLVVTASP